MKNGQETESHLSLQLACERKNIDSTAKSLTNCETLLKKLTDKNEQLGRENTAMADNVCTKLRPKFCENEKIKYVLLLPGGRFERAFERITKT